MDWLRLLTIVVLVAPGLTLTFCAAQTQRQGEVPSAKAAQSTPDFSQEGFVIEQFITRVRFENNGTGQRELQVRIRVQSDAGVQQLSQLEFGYNAANERLEINSVEVHNADGSTITAAADTVQDLTSPVARDAPVYTDTREKHVTVTGLRPGGTLSYHTTTRIHTALATGQFWLEHDFFRAAIVLDEQVEVSVPRNRAIKLRAQPGAEPTITEENDRRIYRWKTSHLQREDENQNQGAQKKPQKKPGAPAIQLTTFQSWEEVGRWYEALARDRVKPTQAIQAKASELTRGRSTDAEKVEALYDFVAKNFRYVSLSFGVGRYQPHAASDVLANRYGDCKDKHTLLQSLTEAIGLRAYPALIHSTRKIDPDMPSPAQFDHMISVVALGSNSPAWYWLDSTTEVAPFRMLVSGLRGKKALVIPNTTVRQHSAGPPRLVETPPDPPFAATQLLEVKGQVSELGKLTAQVRYTLRGDNELLLRVAFGKTPQNQWKQIGELLAVSDGFRGDVTEVKASDPAVTREPFQVEYRITQQNYLDWGAKKSQLALPLPAISLPDAPETESDAGAEPVELGTPLDVTTRVELELPVTFAARAPVAVGVLRDYAEYRSLYKVAGNKVVAERALRFKLREVPAARAPDYAAFTRAVRADEGQSLSIESTSAYAPAIPESAKAADLYESGTAALRAGNYSAAVQMLERVVQLEPQHKHCWGDLGRAYSFQAQLDKAVAAFRKQIELNPSDKQANLFLGITLSRQQKYDEAAQTLRKQLELNPLDGRAHAALGTVYLEAKKYAEAVPELEKADALMPNSPSLQVGLGQAYLNLGKNDQALGAFDKAVELAPASNVRNNVAYQLALKGVHLDRAQRYAESAVAATAAELRNATLERLRPEDLTRVNDLAAYWDTLGWVHFQKGELDAAEKYLRASWLLTQDSEVGDHLGQVYEKQGRKQQAIDTYALALAASRPTVETRGRLAHLAGGENQAEELSKQAAGALAALRTVKLGKLLKESANAEFFVLLAPSSAQHSSASAPSAAGPLPRVEEVKYVSGSEKLRPMAEALRSARVPAVFPDDTPTKLVRRGILSCSTLAGECVFELLPPENVTSVN